ncbi:restriction endonuclease subunit S [Campylobacter sp. FMV-PI01]|uniref:Restriction endonuclease subunit S n=1 Tax=Campylobacter portucalensis TaxID=2608384 RepID=A0A6L5WMC9_9BACT|nr:restriction endonuclease subunit S [Campylobacter portucalensis]MSN96983.1 restriction endonuclease subunit S [Campylobacter portucalensis]
MRKYKLSDLAKINSFSLLGKNKITEVKYLDTSNLISNEIVNFKIFKIGEGKIPSRAKRKVKQNTILYSTVRPNQKHFGILKNLDFSNILVSTGFCTIDVDDNIADPDFIYYYITQDIMVEKMQSLAEQSTTSYPSITPNDIKNIDINLPQIDIQRKVGKILSNIENKIKLNNKINDNLEKQMHLIFKDIMAKSTNNKIKGEFIVAKNLTQVITGKEDANFSVKNGRYKFFTCSNEPLKCDEYKFNNSSVLIAGNGDFNVKHYTGKFNAYQRTYVLTPKKDYYALLYLSCAERINTFKSKSTGSIVKFITKNDIENIPVFIPKDKNILNRLNKLLSLKEKKSKENEYLESLKDFLLPLLMNAQATISD